MKDLIDRGKADLKTDPIPSKGAGAFHSAGQSKEGKFVLVLPSIRFSWNFYQIMAGGGGSGGREPESF